MTNQEKSITGNKLADQTHRSAGDAAVDGLLAGIGAGLLMAAYLVVAGLLSGNGPAEVLGGFDPGQSGSAVLGLLTHLAVSGIYGVLFAVAFRAITRRWPSARRLNWLFGLLYGALLFLVAQFIILPTGNSPMAGTAVPHVVIAHLLFGLLLGVRIKSKT